ncbi:DsrE family protein [Halococcus agarilyticus]|uniref:DsrE family protein n=1 Tax=Halococcus agarilyticus TaxID=1232219 RepID=UPI000677C9B5|nr:DsrE family protein [Halococcus agarilyticus]
MKAVFHHSNDDTVLHERVVNNVANLLDDDSIDLDAVAVVTNSGGLALVTENSPQREHVETLMEHGVAFKQCRNTLAGTDTTAEDLIDGVELVPAGVGELTRLQAEGYAYIKP